MGGEDVGGGDNNDGSQHSSSGSGSNPSPVPPRGGVNSLSGFLPPDNGGTEGGVGERLFPAFGGRRYLGVLQSVAQGFSPILLFHILVTIHSSFFNFQSSIFNSLNSSLMRLAS